MNFFKPKFWDKNKISIFSILLFPFALLIKLLNFLKHQLTKVLSTKKEFKKVIIAYEPVWAIGTGKTPTVKDISNTILYMKNILAKKSSIYKQVQILYGGSVNVNNSKLFLNNMNIDGLLVGKASLNFNSFFSMIKHK